MRIPLFLASASGMAQQILDAIPQMSYDPNVSEGVRQGAPRLVVLGKRFLLYRVVVPHPTQEGVIVSNFDLGPESQGTGGKWALWILYGPDMDPTRAKVRDVYTRLKAWVRDNAAGYLLGPYTPARAKVLLPPALSVAIFAGDALPHVIAGDVATAQDDLDDADLEEPE